MLRKFYKMHGIGNDYIYFDCLDTPLENPEAAALKLSDRHFGIGGDGIVLICPSVLADAKMRMFNADGSEGKMCGNAIRCVGKYLYDFQKTNKTTLKIETLSGVKTLFLNVENGKTQSVKVDMGAPSLSPEQIPVRLGGEAVVLHDDPEALLSFSRLSPDMPAESLAYACLADRALWGMDLRELDGLEMAVCRNLEMVISERKEDR